jgi:hypothetical protein
LCEGEENLCVQKRFLASKLNALPNSGSLESIRFHHHHHFNGCLAWPLLGLQGCAKKKEEQALF